MSYAEVEAICVAAAEAGAARLRELFGMPREISLKGRIDLVTDADRASEELILALLRERAPGSAILAEESGESGRGDLRFIVDPLDGTTNYAHGLPIFACTVGAEEKGVLVAGCTVDPMRGETYRGHRGGGAYLNGVRMRASRAEKLSDSVVCTGFPYDKGGKLGEMIAAFGRFTSLARGTRRLGSAALDLAYVAAGRLDIFYEQGLKPWDVAAGLVLVAEAGGTTSRFDGSPADPGAAEVLACAPALAEEVRRILSESRARPWKP
ncbi:MAG: inositol monophosphatase family protein [Myxococcales bacterium]